MRVTQIKLIKFSRNCIVNFLDDCINNSKVLNITCPLEGCIEEYTEDVIKSNVSDVMFQKYLKFKKIKLITSNPNNFLCPKEVKPLINNLRDVLVLYKKH